MITLVRIEDVSDIEYCGSMSLPIYYKKKELESIVNDEDYILCKYSLDDKLLGFIVSKLYTNRLHIMSIAVYQDERKKKLGSKMIDWLKTKHSYITLYVQQSNKIAIQFYKKNGFKIVREIPNYYFNLDCNHAYLMAYFLDKK